MDDITESPVVTTLSRPRKSLTSNKNKGRTSISKRILKSLIQCTACPHGNDAESIHPILFVPVCGACNVSYENRDKRVDDKNELSCIWCGHGDGCELFMCDCCVLSYCTDCIERNFGYIEMVNVRNNLPWTCYICSESPKLTAKQMRDTNITLHSIDKAYTAIKPPKEYGSITLNEELISSLSLGEKLFASIFSDEITSSIFQDVQIVSYLSAKDIFAVIHRISKKLRLLFQTKAVVLPGLFQTPYGVENDCKLHKHQVVSLHTMLAIENKEQEFGALRGGIFGDEPGLGKTVTTLALIAATAGTSPKSLDSDEQDIALLESRWQSLGSQKSSLVLPIINKIAKFSCIEMSQSMELQQVLKHTHNLSHFKQQFHKTIQSMNIASRWKGILKQSFNFEMKNLEQSLDPKQRKALKSRTFMDQRRLLERSLVPSTGTLIIVPSTLLEHWFEQIMRHLELNCYGSYDNEDGSMDLRGLVYLDSLGDIVDIQPPVSWNASRLNDISNISVEELSSYLIVITTMERCALEAETLLRITDTMDSNNSSSVADAAASSEFFQAAIVSNPLTSVLLKVRWLRMIVDEGHDLGVEGYDLHDGESSQPKKKKRKSNAAADNTTSTVSSTDNGTVVAPDTTNTNTNETLSTKDNNHTEVKRLRRAGEFIRIITAERRWVMSGTPTTGAHSAIGLNQLYYLLRFLRHPQFECSALQSHAAAYHKWTKEVVEPCLQQRGEAWQQVLDLLRQILVRHTKSDINLFDPIHSNINLVPCPSADDLLVEASVLATDRAKAKYIVQTLRRAQIEWKKHSQQCIGKRSSQQFVLRSLLDNNGSIIDDHERRFLFDARRPKAIVFSQNTHDLQGVGHFLYTMMGDSAVCEHYGQYQSAELSRFRHSKKKFRTCPLCHHENGISCTKYCEQTLYLVQYRQPLRNPQQEQEDDYFNDHHADVTQNYPPQPGGHGATGPGGHYVGKCLCSPTGCAEGSRCEGYPNPFYTNPNANVFLREQLANVDVALVKAEHFRGWLPGNNYEVNQVVYVLPSGATEEQEGLLWQGGRLGGEAVIVGWRRCGGRNIGPFSSWHGPNILQGVPWVVVEEEASVLLLQQDGSTGLDLSFATHIFLLERITDPALRNQIISRAHRVGATGPVFVQLLQVVSETDPSLVITMMDGGISSASASAL